MNKSRNSRRRSLKKSRKAATAAPKVGVHPEGAIVEGPRCWEQIKEAVLARPANGMNANALRPWLILLALAWGGQVAHAQVAEHDIAGRNEATRSDTLTYHGEPVTHGGEPVSDEPTEPGIVMAERFDVGKFIRGYYDGPEIPGATASYEWLPDSGVDFHVLPDERSYLATAPPRDEPYIFSLKLTYKIGELTLPPYRFSDSTRVGEAPKPKPLAELAGQHKAALSAWYFAQLDAAAYIESPAKFHEAHAGKLAALGLADSEYAAEVAKRFEKIGDGDWPLPLIAALKGVVKELGLPPEPDPNPPGPTPGPAPIPAAGLHVLVIEESDDRGRIDPKLLAVLQTTQIRTFVQSKGGKFRQYDDDPELADPLWEVARSRPRTTLPWIIVSNGTSGIEQPLPASIEETLALIGRFAQ